MTHSWEHVVAKGSYLAVELVLFLTFFSYSECCSRAEFFDEVKEEYVEL